MNSLLTNQKISRRVSSAGIKRPIKPDSGIKFDMQRNIAHRKSPVSDYRQEKCKKERKFSFSVPIFPMICFGMMIFGIFLAINSRINIPGDLLSRNVVLLDPPVSNEKEYSVALISPPSIMPIDNFSQEKETAETPAAEDLPLNLTDLFFWKSYTVKSGDTVSGIAAAFGLSMDAVIVSNNITNARLLRAGEILRLPNMDGIPYIVGKGDTLSAISKSMGVPLEAILDANDIEKDYITAGESIFIPGARMKSEELKLVLGELFIYPVKGARLTSPFGWRSDPIDSIRRFHNGIDLATAKGVGTPIYASMDGEVIGRGYDKNLGNYIAIKHTGGYQTLYAHLDSFLVNNREKVRQGGQIATMGNTGRSTGAHLHFAIYKNQQAVNPIDFLKR